MIPLTGPAAWPPALRLIAALGAPEPWATDTSALTTADWSDFADLVCGRHRLSPVIAPALSLVSAPESVISRIEASARENAMMSLAYLDLLRRILKACETVEVEPVVLKGIVLGEQLYGGGGNRHARDLDLAIPADRLVPVVGALRPLGLDIDPEHRLRGKVLGSAALIAECNDLALRHGTSGLVVELHWRAHHFRGWPDWLDADTEIWQMTGGEKVHVLEERSNLVYLATHGAMHLWSRLKWLADIARLAVRRDARLEAVLTLAENRQAERPLVEALGLCHALGWLNCPFPVNVDRHLARIADPRYAPGTPQYRWAFNTEGLRLSQTLSQSLGVLRYATWRRLRLGLAGLR